MPPSVVEPSPSAYWPTVDIALSERGVPVELRAELEDQVRGRHDGLLLYGSWARGDSAEGSDLDIIALNSSGQERRDASRVSLSRYTSFELRDMSGTLFGYHLARDGVVLIDHNGLLAQILGSIQAPERGTVLLRIRSLSSILDVAAEDRSRYIRGLTKTARYLLRSAFYADALDRGAPTFSVREIAERQYDSDLVSVLSSHSGVCPTPSEEVFEDLRLRLGNLIGPLETNPYGGLHELIEGAWRSDRDLSNFATLALADDDNEPLYDELPKVTL